MFFIDYLTLRSVGKIKFHNINELIINETIIDSSLLISGVEKKMHDTFKRLPDTILLPPMIFEQNKYAWQEWWNRYSFDEFKIRARLANCLSVFTAEEIDSMLQEWNDTSNLDFFNLDYLID